MSDNIKLPVFTNIESITFVDNVTTEFARQYSNLYTGVLFFTNNNEIWKDGKCYSNIISIDPNANSFKFEDAQYKLALESGVLKVKIDTALYWGIFGDNNDDNIFNKIIGAPSINADSICLDNKEFGWRFITDDLSIINSTLNAFEKNPFGKGNNPIFDPSQIVDISENSEEIEYKDKEIIFFNNKEGVDNIHIFLPKILVDNYKIGIYDDMDGCVFNSIDNSTVTIYTESDNEEYIQNEKKYEVGKFNGQENSLNYFNIDLNNLTDINNYINFLDKTNDYSKYITYYHYIISKRGNKKLNKFNLRIYSKEKI